MSECVILFRNTSNNAVGFIQTDKGEGEIEVFPHMDAAIECADRHMMLRAYPFQIVELDEI